MTSALYYPFTRPDSEAFFKKALFLWDTVDFIVPYDDFVPYDLGPHERRALELVGRNYVPTDSDKEAAHEELKKLCESRLPQDLYFQTGAVPQEYNFYPEKLHWKTWEMLEASDLAKVARQKGVRSEAATRPLFGYYMMSVLATCCAHDRKRLVTDNPDPYRALANSFIDEKETKGAAEQDWHGRLLALSLPGPSFNDVPLEDLLNLRKREDKLLRDLRQNYVKEVDKAASEISKHGENPNVARDVIENFTRSITLDLAELKKALGANGTGILLSKEFGQAVMVATVGFLITPVTGVLAAAGGLLRGLKDYRDRRRKLLREHPAAWLEIAGRKGIKFA